MDTHDVWIISAVITLAVSIIKFGDRLWKPAERVEQNPICGFQHTEIRSALLLHVESLKAALTQQNETLKEMVSAYRASVEDSRLRHQIIVDKLDGLSRDFRENRK